MKKPITSFARWLQPQNPIVNSVVIKIFKVIMMSGAVFVIGLLSFSIIAALIKRATPQDEPTALQQAQIDQAIDAICHLDKIICQTATTEKIQYKVLNLSAVLDIGRTYYWSHYAVTHRTESGYQISVTNHLFDDLSALSVFLFHELQHVHSSDFKLYEESNDKKTECIDHNDVKKATAVFAEKLEAWIQTPEGRLARMTGSPIVFAKLPGNTIKDCN